MFVFSLVIQIGQGSRTFSYFHTVYFKTFYHNIIIVILFLNQ